MVYGFCYKRSDNQGRKYTSCPGYKQTLNMYIPEVERKKLVRRLMNNGYGKHAEGVVQKMLRSGRGMEEYSKKTGKLKKGSKKR